jgi:hypothetical protein
MLDPVYQEGRVDRTGIPSSARLGDESLDPTLWKIQCLFGKAVMTLGLSDISDSRGPLWKTMDNTFTHKLLSAAVSGFKGSEKRHNTSFLDELKPQSEEEDNML